MNRISAIVFGLFLYLTYKDLFYGQVASDSKYIQPIEGSKFSDNVGELNSHRAPEVRFQYCQSCGYRQAYEQHARILERRFPNIKVYGEIHQPSWLKGKICSLLSIFKIVAILLICIEMNPFSYFGMSTPDLWGRATQHKAYSVAIILFLSNAIESNMMSTGGFEIFYNDIPIWSKLESTRIPDPMELIDIVESHQTNFSPKKMDMVFTNPDL